MVSINSALVVQASTNFFMQNGAAVFRGEENKLEKVYFSSLNSWRSLDLVPQLQNRTTCTINFWNRTRSIPAHGVDRFSCCPTPVTVPTQICLPFPSPRNIFRFGYFFQIREPFKNLCNFFKSAYFFQVHVLFQICVFFESSFNFKKLM